MKNLIIKAFKKIFRDGPMEEFAQMAIKDLKQYRAHAIDPSKGYPLLTIDRLDYIVKKLSYQIESVEDFKTIDHYLNSAGLGDYINNRLRKYEVYSYDYLDFILRDYLHPKSGQLIGVLLGGIYKLRERVAAGEKIY